MSPRTTTSAFAADPTLRILSDAPTSTPAAPCAPQTVALTPAPAPRHQLLGRIKPLALALALLFSGTQLASAATPSPTNFPQSHASYDFKAHGLRYEGSEYFAYIQALDKKANYKLLWQDFHLEKGHTLQYVPNADGPKEVSFLNIVKGGPRSLIQGEIKAGYLDSADNANLPKVNFYLINPNGISLQGSMLNFNDVYLSTEQVSSDLLQRFDRAESAVTLPELTAADCSDLNLGEGMGKVRLLGKVQAQNLLVNGSQIIIHDVEDVLSDADKAKMPASVELVSSTNRIDIGGPLDETIAGSDTTYRDYLKEQGLEAAPGADATLQAALKPGQYVDHSAQVAIGNVGDFDKAAIDWSAPKLWLVDDLELNKDEYAKLQTLFAERTASGYHGNLELDGAYNTIVYKGEVTTSGAHGLFGALNGANISNLKIYGSSLHLASDLPSDQELNLQIGALAGTMTDTTLHNVAVQDFTVTGPYGYAPDIKLGAIKVGGLAGTIGGHTKLTNVSANLGRAERDLTHNAYADSVISGHLTGYASGDLVQHGIVLAGGAEALEVQALGERADDALGWEISTSFEQAAQAADGRGDAWQDFYVTTEGAGELKGFLKPYFVHDYTFTYDGTSHNYQELTDAVNEGFDLNDYFEVDWGSDCSNAGEYYFDLTGRPESVFDSERIGATDFGENFYVTYSHAGETWAGDGAAERRERADVLSGYGTIVIKKKPVEVVIGEQTVMRGDEDSLNLTVSADTIDNLKDLTALLEGCGDTLEDLGLKLSYDANIGEIVGSYESDNYEVTITAGKVTLTEPPEPEPEPNPEPTPTPDPEPELPDTPLEPDVPDTPSQPVVPVPQPQPQGPSIEGNVMDETKCQNCGEISQRGLDPSWTRLYNQAQLFLGSLDYTPNLMAALLSPAQPKAEPRNEPPAPELMAQEAEAPDLVAQQGAEPPADDKQDARATAQNRKPQKGEVVELAQQPAARANAV